MNSVKNQYGGDASPRTSFFIYIHDQDILIRKWNPEEEQFYPEDKVDEDEMLRYAHGVKRLDFDNNLGAYPMDTYKKWLSLSNFITEDLMKRLQPIGAVIDSSSKPLTQKEKELLKEDVSIPASPRNARKPFYTKIPKRIKCSDPKLVAKYNFDKSYIFNQVIKENHNGDPNGMLGEMQFAFIGFLLGQSFESFEQWKEIITLLLNCEEALDTHTEFFVNAIIVLQNQLQEITESFFEDVITENNFLHHLLRGFLDMTLSDDIDPKLRDQAKKLKKLVERRFGMDFSAMAEDDEYMPVIVV